MRRNAVACLTLLGRVGRGMELDIQDKLSRKMPCPSRVACQWTSAAFLSVFFLGKDEYCSGKV